MDGIKLVDAIALLRHELYKANEAGSTEELKLKVGAVEVEFEIEIEEREGDETQYGFDIWVFGLKRKTSDDSGNKRSHRIKLHLEPEMNRLPLHIKDETKRAND